MALILIVDDSESIRRSVTRNLNTWGHEVIEAVNGLKGVEIATAEAPDLILMDIMMPEMDGIEAITKIRELPERKGVPIITLSGIEERETWVEAFKAGADDYVVKPFFPEELKHRIKNHLERAEALAKLERERDLARKIQQGLLPKIEHAAGLEIEAYNQASSKLGGDFYDTWQRGNDIYFAVGDICGHDTAAALLMAASKGVLASVSHTHTELSGLAAAFNARMRDIFKRTGGFLTLSLLRYNAEWKSFEIVNAGQRAVHLKPDGFEIIEPTGGLIGYFEDAEWKTETRELKQGESIWLFSDGIVEVMNANNKQFGHEGVARALYADMETRSLRALLMKCMQKCLDHAGKNTPPDDDLTLLGLRQK